MRFFLELFFEFLGGEDFLEGERDEGPIFPAGVWESECVGIPDFVIAGDDIDIEGPAVPVWVVLWASQGDFQGLCDL